MGRLRSDSKVTAAFHDINEQLSTTIIAKKVSMPVELLSPREGIDLSRWSIVLKNDNLITLANSFRTRHSKAPQQELETKLTIQQQQQQQQQDKTPGAPSPLLKQLNLSGSKQITDFGIATVVQVCEDIIDINLSDCDQLTDASIRQVGLRCKQLKTFQFCNSAHINGDGLLEVANNCKLLISVNLSNCHNVESSYLTNLFSHCYFLENVNVEGIVSVTDLELKTLSLHCPNIRQLNLCNCIYVSDQSLIYLSQGCTQLEALDISRQSMAFRITDVGMMALGQKMLKLKTLKVRGCDHITDVGVHWLSEICHELEELDLGLCGKISDGALRSLGTRCNKLQKLNLTNLKLISDIGIRSLSQGCPQLIKLNCQGVFLLSDQKYLSSTSTSGAAATLPGGQKLRGVKDKTTPGPDPIGIAALRLTSPLMQNLNLSGCFRLNVAIQLQVSCFEFLKQLHLNGCVNVVSEAVVKIGEKCPLLEELYLNDCIKAVDAKSMTSVAKGCLHLKILSIARCPNVKGETIIQVSQNCRKLVTWNLSGCKSLTDTTLLPICEPLNLPVLTFLDISFIDRATDTFVAWLAFKHSRVETLSLKGTAATSVSVKAVQSQFAYSDVLRNETFFGYVCKHRSHDVRFVNEYTVAHIGLIKIQALWRGGKHREIARQVKYIRDSNRAATKIQSIYRMFVAVSKRKRLFNILHQQNNASIKILSAMRMVVAKYRLRQLKRIALRNQQIEACCHIQLAWRMHRDWNKRKHLIAAKLATKQKLHKAATKVQSIVRRRLGIKKTLMERALVATYRRLQLQKIQIIQRYYRGYLGRKRATSRRRTLQQRQRLEEASSQRIKYCFHNFRLRQEIAKRAAKTDLLRRMATTLQCFVRCCLARNQHHDRKYLFTQRIYYAKAVTIQCAWRQRLSRRWLDYLKEKQWQRQQLEQQSAHCIQMYVRQFLAKKQLNALKDAHVQELKLFMELEIRSAITLQSWFRGILGRRVFQQLIREKKGRWKELWDEQNQQRFFFNQMTGEIRYRIPQDLLDLIPASNCDNCNRFEAKMECANCDELYCHQCFQQIHSGGRRKDHEFRCIYDYYDKRVDYGEGCFPCKWPTEILQDEIQGWMLRVAPIRQPVIVRGEWEEYHDTNGNPFYFNRQTFETSYDVPPSIQQYQQLEWNYQPNVSGQMSDMENENVDINININMNNDQENDT